MYVRYQMTRGEWHEAIRIFQTKRRAPVATGLIWICILAPLGGALAEDAREWQTTSDKWNASIAPLLVALVCLAAAAVFVGRLIRRNQSALNRAMPQGLWEMHLGEEGVTRRDPETGREGAQYAWDEFSQVRLGRKVVVLELAERAGLEALPLRSLSVEQVERLTRLVARKVHRVRPAEESRTGLD